MVWYENTEEEFLENDVTPENLEKAFTDYKHYLAMKSLYKIEKMVLYMLIIELLPIKEVCRRLGINKYEVMKIKERALKKFRNNLKRICKKEEEKNCEIRSK